MMLDLDAIEARAEAATPGPWYEDDVTFGTGTLVIARFDDTVVQCSLPLSHTRSAPNADFIAHARTDIPALVAELRAARADITEMAYRGTALSGAVDGLEGIVATQDAGSNFEVLLLGEVVEAAWNTCWRGIK
jgi:hypothetical protein